MVYLQRMDRILTGLVEHNMAFIYYSLFDLIDMECTFMFHTLYSVLRKGAEKAKSPASSHGERVHKGL